MALSLSLSMYVFQKIREDEEKKTQEGERMDLVLKAVNHKYLARNRIRDATKDDRRADMHMRVGG